MTTSFIDVDGGRLAFELAGDGPLVLCSPALGDTQDAFEPLVRPLVDSGYRVARVDLRGHGQSGTGFSKYGDEATAEDLLAVIDELGGGPTVLAGASMSAAAAVIAAGRHPEKVAGLVLIGPFLRNGAGAMMRQIMRVALARPWGPSVWRGYSATLWPGLGDKASARAARNTALLTRPGRWSAFLATTSGADHRVVAPWIGRVLAPVLVVMGDSDPDWKDPLAEAQWVASNFAGAETLAVPGAGHAPMLESPAVVGRAIVEFLGKIFSSDLSRASNA